MKVADYEKTYVSVKNGLADTEYLDRLVDILRSNCEPMTCADLGYRVFGERYGSEYMGKSLAGRMGQMLRHLRQGGFIKIEERKGDPIEIEVEEYIYDNDDNGEPPMITVHDDKGREYRIQNPNYSGHWSRGHGHWGKVKKTVTPTIKTYFWVA